MNHTPEPWHEFTHPAESNRIEMKYILSKRDYTRAILCVNACAGIDNPVTHIKSAKSVFDDELKELTKIQDQKNRLITLMTDIRQYMLRNGVSVDNADIFNEIDRAIKQYKS